MPPRAPIALQYNVRQMDTPVTITGAVLVGDGDPSSGDTFIALNPATGRPIEPAFYEADAGHVTRACEIAAQAFGAFSELTPGARASFLQCVGSEILAIGDQLIERAMAETGLPRARLEGERIRTVGQLNFFANLVRDGAWIDATIDQAKPDRAPVARPDLRRRHVAIGPVAVFGASNFPLAFSVAGGDTASALAAGCPVVVKGHPAHPGTGELVARAVRGAVAKSGVPIGTFSYLPGRSESLGAALVSNPHIRAVGFTGSRAGGLALAQIATARPEPIPVFAEMSSVNPVILFPGAARSRGAELGRAYVASVTLGAGQFCTNPGVVLVLDGSEHDAFVQAAMTAMAACGEQQMLAPNIQTGFNRGAEQLSRGEGVRTLARGGAAAGANMAQAGLFAVEAARFMTQTPLRQELFGPASVVVRARDIAQIAAVIEVMEGQLTATVLFDEEDLPLVAELLPRLERKVGRIIGNGWPTGVEVCHAMVHGGPYPATTDVRSTSVGALAIQRFLRPICYQNLPDELLPPVLRSDNPFNVSRRVDGTVQAPQAPA
jgi:alpha-ketoglutaric semialdehyde dehydrogenase